MKKELLILVFLLLLVPVVYAKEGHMKLLAVSETEDGYKGREADLHLEIKKGTGKVFIDTYPLTKLDTQISTRFAKGIACKFLEKDCTKYDFFYTIESNSQIVGGPSAGAAIAALTVSLLDDNPLDKRIALTGTINSGGFVGQVGGIKQKIEIASEIGMKKILIPSGKKTVTEDNVTINITDIAKENNIQLTEVATLNDVMFEFTGRRYYEFNQNIEINQKYNQIMMEVAVNLCNRSEKIMGELRSVYIEDMNESFTKQKESADNLTMKAETAMEQEDYYSAASYCFGANVIYKYILLSSQNLTEEQINETANTYLNATREKEGMIDDKEIETINDLEVSIIVKERLRNADELLDRSREYLNESKDDSVYNLAGGIERLYSAFSWSNFFGIGGKQIVVSEKRLMDSCMNKIFEAEERVQYVNLIFPDFYDGMEGRIDQVYKSYEGGEYGLCLYQASEIKASADVVLSLMGVTEEEIEGVVEKRLEIAKNNILSEQEKGNFPLLGYSFYEYAKNLKETDKYSSLLYSAYALELSNLNMYFPREETQEFEFPEEYWYFISGVSVGLLWGIIIGVIIIRLTKRRPRKNH